MTQKVPNGIVLNEADWQKISEIQEQIDFESVDTRRTHFLGLDSERARDTPWAGLLKVEGEKNFSSRLISVLRQVNDPGLNYRHLDGLLSLAINERDKRWLTRRLGRDLPQASSAVPQFDSSASGDDISATAQGFVQPLQSAVTVARMAEFGMDKPTVVVVATGWGAMYGGINAFNLDFCLALGRFCESSVRVLCLCSCEGVDDLVRARLRDQGVEVLVLKGIVSRDPAIVADDGREVLVNVGVKTVDLIIGHDVITGRVALALKSSFGEPARTAIIHHMSYVRYRGISGNGPAALDGEELQREVLCAADHVFAVGPLLQESACELLDRDDVPMLVPGIADIAPRLRRGKRFRAITFGRLGGKDDLIKQGKLAAVSFGAFVKLREGLQRYTDYEFTAFGLSDANFEDEEKRLKALVDTAAGRVVTVNASPYLLDRAKLFEKLRQHDAALMLSVHEGFGLAGWEAIGAGVPLLVSKNSGLYKLLLQAQLHYLVYAIDVQGTRDEDPDSRDIAAVSGALAEIADNIDVAYQNASQLRMKLGALYTWDRCVRIALETCGITQSGPAAIVTGHAANKGFGRVGKLDQVSTTIADTAVSTGTKFTVLQFLAGDLGGNQRSNLQIPAEDSAIRDDVRRATFRDHFRIPPSIYSVSVNQLINCQELRPSIVHFAGHGEERTLVVVRNRAGIYFETMPLSVEDAETIFSHFTPRLRLLVLNSCNSQAMAAHLTGKGVVELALGFPGKISDDSARDFATTIYRNLAEGKSALAAFELARVTIPGSNTTLRPQLFSASGVNPEHEYFAGPNF